MLTVTLQVLQGNNFIKLKKLSRFLAFWFTWRAATRAPMLVRRTYSSVSELQLKGSAISWLIDENTQQEAVNPD